jgi:hypothetical protein
MTWLISSEQTLAAARKAGVDEDTLRLSGAVVLTFSKGVVDRLDQMCDLEEADWISARHHPYAAAQIVKRGAGRLPGLRRLVIGSPGGVRRPDRPFGLPRVGWDLDPLRQ